MNKKPLVTIGLPLYKMENIQWLAFESIRRQNTLIPFEVIVYVEKEYAGNIPKKIVHPYCVNYKVELLDSWMPLPLKWKFMINEARGDVFMLHGGDDYSDLNRLNRAYRDIYEEGYDWTQDKDGWSYHIQKQKLLRYKQIKKTTGINIAFKTSLAKYLPQSTKPSGVDWWLRKNIASDNIKWNENENMSVFTTGYNIISFRRNHYFDNVHPPFHETKKDIIDLLPKDIALGLTP